MNSTISDSIRDLLAIVARLRSAHPKKRFTLDGRLVGDIGEAVAEILYDLSVFDRLQKHHDAITSDGRQVQIKATMQKSLTFPADHIPDYYLGLQIAADGSVTEIFNGPGNLAYAAIKNRQKPKTNLHSISVSTLSKISKSVPERSRIPKRSSLA